MKQIFKAIWKNNAEINVVYYDEKLEGEDSSDRIHLLIKPAGGKETGFILNIQDATDIIYGLSKAMSVCIENKIPPTV
jgi:hypothetical protein